MARGRRGRGAARGAVVGLVLVAAVGAGVLALVAGSGSGGRGAAAPRPPGAGAEASPEASSGRRVVVEVNAGERDGAGRAVADGGEAAPPTPAGEAAEPGAAADHEARLRVRIVGLGGEPLEGVRVAVQLAGAGAGRRLVHVDRPRGTHEEAVRTDVLGQAVLFVPPGREGTLVAWTADDSVEAGGEELAALAPLERKDVELVLRTADERRVAGRVVAAAGGSPIEGAFVHVRTAAGVVERATSGRDGGFAVREPAVGPAALRVEAEGFTPAFAPTEAGTERTIALARTAALAVTVASPTDVPAPGCTVAVRARAADLLVPGSEDAPLPPLQDVEVAGRETTNARGRLALAGLPAGVPLALEVRGEPFGLLEEAVAPLGGGETRKLYLVHGRPLALVGRLVDREGRPVAGQEVWLKAVPGGTEARYFDCGDRDARADFTSGAGVFRFADVYGGTYLVGSAVECGRWPPGESGPTNRRTRNANEVATLATPVRVPHVLEIGGEEEVEIELRRDVGLYLLGRVLDGKGEPVPWSSVSARSLDHRGLAAGGRVRSSKALFRLGPVARERYELVAHSPRERARSSPRVVRGGADPVDLVLGDPEPSGELVGFVVDEQGAGLAAAVWWDDSPFRAVASAFRFPPGPPRAVVTDPLGRFEIELPEAGMRRLVAHTEDESRMGFARVLVTDPGEHVEGPTIVLPPPGRIRIVERRERERGETPRPWEGRVAVTVGGFRAMGRSIRKPCDWGDCVEAGEAIPVPSGRIEVYLDGWPGVRVHAVDVSPGGEVVVGWADGPGGPDAAGAPR